MVLEKFCINDSTNGDLEVNNVKSIKVVCILVVLVVCTYLPDVTFHSSNSTYISSDTNM